MKPWVQRLFTGRLVMGLMGIITLSAASGKGLNLEGFSDPSGAISVVKQGDAMDPYFALQALLIAHASGLDMGGQDVRLAQWLADRFKRDGKFNRYCRSGAEWRTCQPTDADDAVLALWLNFVKTLPVAERAALVDSPTQDRATRELIQLRDPRNGIYNISWQLNHALFMDNLEVWSNRPTRHLARSIQNVFWDKKKQRYKVSTQPGHQEREEEFYPSVAAQIYPLLVNFPLVPGGSRAHYKRWMALHRGLWLTQMQSDYPWGLIAWIAHRQGDSHSVRCWQTASLQHKNAARWTVTDEVIAQILPPLNDSPPSLEDCQ
jgi:hypothetical protein